MSDRICIPVKIVGSDRWGQLSAFGNQHIISGERCDVKDQNYSFSGGHRVRLYSIKQNVHWKIPAGIQLDVSQVAPATLAAAKQPPRRRR
jgi:hypothetical protein